MKVTQIVKNHAQNQWLRKDVIWTKRFFDILVGNTREINSGFYVKMKSRGAITRQSW